MIKTGGIRIRCRGTVITGQEKQKEAGEGHFKQRRVAGHILTCEDGWVRTEGAGGPLTRGARDPH